MIIAKCLQDVVFCDIVVVPRSSSHIVAGSSMLFPQG